MVKFSKLVVVLAAVAICSNAWAGDFIKISDVLIAPKDRLVITIGSAAGDKIVWTVGVADGFTGTTYKMFCDSPEDSQARKNAIKKGFSDLLTALNSDQDEIYLEDLLADAGLEWCSWG